MHAGRSLIFLAQFFNQTAGDKVLKLLIGTQTEHFLTAAHRISQFQICKNPFEQVVETEDFLFGQNTAKLIGDVVR